LDELVDRAVAGVRESDRWCANRFFGDNVKPLLYLVVGDGRGYPVDEAANPDDQELKVMSFRELLEEGEQEERFRRPASNAYERMLRTSEAWDAACTRLYDKLPDCRGCNCL
jgi:hypothetical protein